MPGPNGYTLEELLYMADQNTSMEETNNNLISKVNTNEL